MNVPRQRRQAGFSLIELAIGLVIVATLLASLIVPLVTQLDQKRTSEAQRQLEQAREALIGFAAANNRLPCPATGATGNESFAAGGNATTGACAASTGFLPGVTLGMSPLDAQGFYVDAFASDRNRMRYAVADQTINGVTNPFTRINGMKTNAMMNAIAASTSLLFVCSGTPAATNCGTATPLANGTAIAVVLSPGKNAVVNTPSGDEQENLDTDDVFVSRIYSDRTVGSTVFDDQMLWLSPATLFSRMLSAGALP